MRNLLAGLVGFIFAGLLVSAIADAQYAPNSTPLTNAALPFQPLGKTSAVSASTTSASIQLSVVANQVQVANPTTGVAFVIFCSTSVCTAAAGSGGTSTSDYPVAAGATIVLTVPNNTTWAAVILSTSTGLVYLTPGQGL
jgi:hypothetical protein